MWSDFVCVYAVMVWNCHTVLDKMYVPGSSERLFVGVFREQEISEAEERLAGIYPPSQVALDGAR